MEFLKMLESVRTPFLDRFFSLVTMLGEETVFIVVGLVFFWCINKKHGYYILSVGFLGTVLNQFLKLLFRVPRPWVRDEKFTIVESAREEATGYSFPSGHTQSAVGNFGAIGRINKHLAVRILCALACLLVPLSRMYLGVHTPADVIVSFVIALVLVFGLYPLVGKALESKRGMRIFFASLTAVGGLFLAFVLLYPFPTDTDPVNLESGVKNAYKILACVLGLWLAYEVDEKWTRFETDAVWWAQVLKLLLGLLPILAIKSGLKAPLYALFGGNFLADGVRYFLLVVFAGCVWPLTFSFFARLGKKK
ncbi:MAG: phosphatase PAP2 family protein [Oscillospiraceae bacterium]|nr:phosphatase PAP2 family protein [Oscillospiraceae bacterium]